MVSAHAPCTTWPGAAPDKVPSYPEHLWMNHPRAPLARYRKHTDGTRCGMRDRAEPTATSKTPPQGTGPPGDGRQAADCDGTLFPRVERRRVLHHHHQVRPGWGPARLRVRRGYEQQPPREHSGSRCGKIGCTQSCGTAWRAVCLIPGRPLLRRHRKAKADPQATRLYPAHAGDPERSVRHLLHALRSRAESASSHAKLEYLACG